MLEVKDEAMVVNPDSAYYHQVGKVVIVHPNRGIGKSFVLCFSDGRKLGFGENELQKVE